MIVMGLLQCTWAIDPVRVAKMFQDNPEARNRLVAMLLFGGRCLTGRRLRKAFGPLCGKIVWENATPVIADQASGCPPGDPEHVQAALERIKPDVVLTFGRVAVNTFVPAAQAALYRGHLIRGPHPAARYEDIDERLRDMRRALDKKTKE